MTPNPVMWPLKLRHGVALATISDMINTMSTLANNHIFRIENSGISNELPGRHVFFYLLAQTKIPLDFFSLKKLDLPELTGAASTISAPPKFLHATFSFHSYQTQLIALNIQFFKGLGL